jgi:Flp pilus assembly protein TadB
MYGRVFILMAHPQVVVRLFDSSFRRFCMTLALRSAFFPLTALCASIIAYSLSRWILDRPTSITRNLQDFALYRTDTPSPDSPVGSSSHKIRLAFKSVGLEISGKEQFFLYFSSGLIGFALVGLAAIFHLPPILWMIGPAVGYFVINTLIKHNWDRLCRRIEREIPAYLVNLASMIQLNANLIQDLEDACLSLDPKGGLKSWIVRLASTLQARGKQGLEEMQQEAQAISPSLLLLVVEVGRMWETGGSGYAQSFQLISENLGSILDSRNKAYAKADGAWGTIRLIVLALGGAIVMAFSSSGSRELFRTPAIQLAMLAAIGWATFGFTVIADLIRESVS